VVVGLVKAWAGQGPAGAGQCPVEDLCFGFLFDLEFCSNDILYFILQTPLNSTVFLYSRDKLKDLKHA
jgi:hypothetical protein